MKLSIVVPCYNEAENIPLLLKRFAEIIDERNISVILVNNGSYDGSEEIFLAELPKYLFASKINVEVNQGYGFGILQGLKIADGDYIGWMHADMQTDPRDIIKAYDIIKKRNKDCFVKGCRHGRQLVDVFFTVGMSVFEMLYLGAKLYDINAQPNIFPKAFFEIWQSPPYDFALDLYAYYMACKQHIDIVRFPVDFPKRIYGESHWNTGFRGKLKFIKRTLDFSKKLKKEGIR